MTWNGILITGGNLLALAMLGLVVVTAIATALRLTRLDLCREAAWVHALGWSGVLVFQMSTVLLRALRPGVAYVSALRWFDLGVQLLALGSLAVAGLGLVLLRPRRGGARG